MDYQCHRQARQADLAPAGSFRALLVASGSASGSAGSPPPPPGAAAADRGDLEALVGYRNRDLPVVNSKASLRIWRGGNASEAAAAAALATPYFFSCF